MIIIEPVGGLCNRMRAVRSAVGIAKRLNKKLVVVWKKNDELVCEFNQIFQPIEDVTVIECNKMGIIRLKLMSFSKVLKQNDLYNGEKTLFTLDDFIKVVNPKIYIKTYSDFFKMENINIFKPKKEIMQKVNKIVNSNNVIGVHIRRTDNQESINNSPIILFEKIIEKEIATNKNKILLSTDSEDVQNLISSKYKENIIFNKKHFSRKSNQGIIDAAIDLYSLSKCKKIYGSYQSSFTDIASEINNVQKFIVTQNTMSDIENQI